MSRTEEIRARWASGVYAPIDIVTVTQAATDIHDLLARVERMEAVVEAARRINRHAEGVCGCDACVAVREFDALEESDGE